MTLYDTHCHLNFKAFENTYRETIDRSLKQGMFLNIVGSQYETSKRAVEIAQEYANAPIYAAVGLHPTHADTHDDVHQWSYERFKSLAQNKKVVAIGETGIDHFRKERFADAQRQIFEEHIRLAKELHKPLIIHCRPEKNMLDAYHEVLEVLDRSGGDIPRGVVHCYLGDATIAEKFIERGLYISFTGIITFTNASPYLIDAIQKIPLDRMLIETDAPYLTPEPLRGKRQNEPLLVEHVAQKIAEIKGLAPDIVMTATTENGRKLFISKTPR